MRALTAWIVAIVRGIGLSGIFVFLFPVLFGGNAIWWAAPAAELAVFFATAFLVVFYLKKGMRDVPQV